MNEDLIWQVRAFVYSHFAATARPPSVAETASRFSLTGEEAASVYEALHQRHALYLQPGTHEILMANPFSGVETPFRVHADGRTYFANCAWDTLGIPAALHADAEIEAACAHSSAPIRFEVSDGNVRGPDVLVHFLIPFREWYDDLAFT